MNPQRWEWRGARSLQAVISRGLQRIEPVASNVLLTTDHVRESSELGLATSEVFELWRSKEPYGLLSSSFHISDYDPSS